MSEGREKVDLWVDGANVGAANPLPVALVIVGPLAVDVSDRAARLVGIVYGDTGQLVQLTPADGLANPANLLGVGAFPHLWDPVALDWNRWREGAGIGQALVDPADRWARQLGLVDLSRVLGAGLSAVNPVVTGLYGVSGDRVPVLPHDLSIPVAPAKIVVQAFETAVGAVAEGAAANIVTSTNHRGAGANSIEFDKAAGNILAGVSYAIPALDLGLYSTHAQVDFWAYIPTPVGGNVVQVYAALGTDNANLFFWAIPVADLTLDAWNHIMLSMMDVSGVLGVGANLSAVTYCAIYVQTSVAGATITNMLVDQLVVKRAFEVNITNKLQMTRDALTPINLVSAGVFPFVYDPVAGDWNQWREGSQIGVPQVEDTGLNTNPRRYEKDNGFRSPVIPVGAGPVATALWTIATTPARTAGLETTIYTLTIENSTGAAITGWLEIGGTAITVPFHVNDGETAVITFVAGLEIGDNDVNCNASAAAVNFSVYGTEA